MHRIYIRVSRWDHATNKKSPDQFSNSHLPPHFLQFPRQDNLSCRAVDSSMKDSRIGHSHSHYRMFIKGLALPNCAFLASARSFVLPCNFFGDHLYQFSESMDVWHFGNLLKIWYFPPLIIFSFHSCPWFTHSAICRVNGPLPHSLEELSSEQTCVQFAW